MQEVDNQTEQQAPREEQAQQSDEAQRLAALEEREKQVALRERQLKALDLLKQRGLPAEALPLLNVGSEEKLKESITHAEKLRDALVKGQAPRVAPPKVDGKMTYAQRAALFLQNGGQLFER